MNFTPVPLLLGIATILGAVALFFLDRYKPGYGRDSDKIYAILLLISGVILLSEWTMPLLSSLQQSIMVGLLTSLLIQNINSRTPLGQRPAPQSEGWDGGYGGGYRPPRPSRPAYGGDSRANLRAELDRPYGPEDPYARPRPMLGGRPEPEAGPGYGYDQPESGGYGNRYGEAPPPPSDRGLSDRPPGPDSSTYSQAAPRSDERLRRRRPKTRSEYSDRYGTMPPRPDYRPDREPPSGGWS